MRKLEVARRQLGVATHLFINDREPVSVHTLACASREILERLCTASLKPSVMSHIAENARRSILSIRDLANQYGRAFKHHDPARNDEELLAVFSDQQNDFLLFIAWHDYRCLTGRMPVEAQALYSWVEALYPDKMAIARNFDHIPSLSGLVGLPRAEQKIRLHETVEHARGPSELQNHPETESVELVLRH